MVRTGHWALLERLRGTCDPVALFTVVPGLGHRLAERIHEELHLDTLEGLELAAHDGRLENVPGVGPRRAAAIRANLHAMLVRGRDTGTAYVRNAGPQPAVGVLLAIDRQYREQAMAGTLPTIAPDRFNPTHEAWLPVLHAEREGWQFTALFSNTAQAHQLKRTRDWVRIFHYDSQNSEGQHTVVTETHGALAGKRVVRGREAECRAAYALRRLRFNAAKSRFAGPRPPVGIEPARAGKSFAVVRIVETGGTYGLPVAAHARNDPGPYRFPRASPRGCPARADRTRDHRPAGRDRNLACGRELGRQPCAAH